MHHFAHKRNTNCTLYDSPSESQMHKEAKRLIAYLVNNRHILTFTRTCIDCDVPCVVHTTEVTNTAKEEYRFNPDNTHRADIGVLSGDRLSLIIEVYHTHLTQEGDRPDPWVEVDAAATILAFSNAITRLKCIRTHICPSCVVKRNEAVERRAIWEKKEAERRVIHEKEEAERRAIREKEAAANEERKKRAAEDYERYMLNVLNETVEMREERKRKCREDDERRSKEIAMGGLNTETPQPLRQQTVWCPRPCPSMQNAADRPTA